MPPLGTLNWTDVGNGIGVGEAVDVATGGDVGGGAEEGGTVLMLGGATVWLGALPTVGAQLATTMARAVAAAKPAKVLVIAPPSHDIDQHG